MRQKHYTKYLRDGDRTYQANVPMQRLFEKKDFPIAWYFEINKVLDGKLASLGDDKLDASLQVIIGNILPNVQAPGRREEPDHQQDTAFHQCFRWPYLLTEQLSDHSGQQLQLVAELKRTLADKKNTVMVDLQDMLLELMHRAKKITKDANFSNWFTGHILYGENYKPNIGL